VRILVVDNGGQWTHREWRVLRDLGVETAIIPNTTPLAEIQADGLVLSGGAPRVGLSGEKMGRIGEYLDQATIPILGICAGHQFMAVHLGGAAGPSAIPEFGKTIIHIDDRNELFREVPDSIQAWESHNDEVTRVPPGFRALAHSENCRVQAMASDAKPLLGLQFHPEVEHTECGETIFENFVRLCERHGSH